MQLVSLQQDPQLAWLAVWNRQLILRHQGHSSSSKETHAKGDVDDLQRVEDDEDDDGEEKEDHAGVLYASVRGTHEEGHHEGSSSTTTLQQQQRTQRDVLSRRIGLAQGLVDFTRSFATPGPSRRQHEHNHDEGKEKEKEKEQDINKRIKVVQSQNQRLVFLQPEPDYWIVAAFDRYADTQGQRQGNIHSRQSSSASTATAAGPSISSSSLSSPRKASNNTGGVSSSARRENQPRLHPSALLPNDTFLQLLMHSYAGFKLFHGSFESVLEREGRAGLETKLKSYLDTWKNSARLLPLGMPLANLPAEYSEFLRESSSQLDFDVVSVSHDGLLPLARSSDDDNGRMTQADELALAIHLMSILLKPSLTEGSVSSSLGGGIDTKGITTLSLNAEKAAKKEKKLRKQASMSSSTWKSLGLGSISSYLPNVPGLPSNSTSTSSSIHTPPSETKNGKVKTDLAASLSANQQASSTIPTINSHGKRTTSGPTWLPSFGIFRSSSPKADDTPRSTTPEVPATPMPDVEAPSDTVDGEVKPEEIPLPVEGQQEEIVLLSQDSESQISFEALSEAIGEDISPAVEGGGNGNKGVAHSDAKAHSESTTQKTDTPPLSWHEPFDIYVGPRNVRKTCHVVYNEQLAIAFISSTRQEVDEHGPAAKAASPRESNGPCADIRTTLENHFRKTAAILANANRKQDTPNRTPVSSSRKQVFCTFDIHNCHATKRTSMDNRAAASTATEQQRAYVAVNASSDLGRLLRSQEQTSEVFVRNYFAQWLVAKPGIGQHGQTLDLTVLPKSVGREGSLLDADYEMQSQVAVL